MNRQLRLVGACSVCRPYRSSIETTLILRASKHRPYPLHVERVGGRKNVKFKDDGLASMAGATIDGGAETASGLGVVRVRCFTPDQTYRGARLCFIHLLPSKAR